MRLILFRFHFSGLKSPTPFVWIRPRLAVASLVEAKCSCAGSKRGERAGEVVFGVFGVFGGARSRALYHRGEILTGPPFLGCCHSLAPGCFETIFVLEY